MLLGNIALGIALSFTIKILSTEMLNLKLDGMYRKHKIMCFYNALEGMSVKVCFTSLMLERQN